MQQIRRWINDSRYYTVRLQKNLFNEWSVLQEWGGLTNRKGNFTIKNFDNFQNAIDYTFKIAKKRTARGYKEFN